MIRPDAPNAKIKRKFRRACRLLEEVVADMVEAGYDPHMCADGCSLSLATMCFIKASDADVDQDLYVLDCFQSTTLKLDGGDPW